MLVDLEELALRCRSPRSRQHLAEAIGCYEAGAYRACIVATWVAVTFDLIDKMNELALSGDNEAKQTLERFHDARARGDIRAALEFEKNLIGAARRLELIAHIEEIDLQRLLEDRHRCAHPSMLLDGEIFVAPPELARLHVHNAVTHVMAQEPAQGKAALDLLLRELQSDYFPRSLEDARKYLAASALRKPRSALLSNFVAVVLKLFVLDEAGAPGDRKYLNALKVVQELHQASWEAALRAHFAKIVARCEQPNQMNRALRVIGAFGSAAWDRLDVVQHIRLANYVETMPSDALSILGQLQLAPLSDAVTVRIMKLRAQDLNGFSPWEYVPASVVDRCIELLRGAPSSRAAESIFDFLIDRSDEMSYAQVEELLVAANRTLAIRKCARRLELYEALIAREDAEACGLKPLVTLSDDYRRVLGS